MEFMYVLKRSFTLDSFCYIYLFHVCKYLKKKTHFRAFQLKTTKLLNLQWGAYAIKI